MKTAFRLLLVSLLFLVTVSLVKAQSPAVTTRGRAAHQCRWRLSSRWRE